MSRTEAKCPDCDQNYRTSVGHCPDCHRSFISKRTAIGHRTRATLKARAVCLTDDQLADKGFYQRPDGYWESRQDADKRRDISQRPRSTRRASAVHEGATGAPGAAPGATPAPAVSRVGGMPDRPDGFCSGGKYRVDYPDGTFSGCGRYLTEQDFEDHRVQREGVEQYSRRCLTDEELLAAGWTNFGNDHWAGVR